MAPPGKAARPPGSVVIFGGGVAGLTAAHELAERGVRVTLYEARTVHGGKARSIDVPRSARGGRKPLPGEHGFRLFPAFYKHIPDTMSRIPFRSNRRGVLDNLISVERTLFASAGRRALRFPVHPPRTKVDIANWLTALVDATDAWVPAADTAFFVQRMLVLLTSCEARRETELESTSWTEFMESRSRSPNYQRYLAGGLTRSLVAMNADDGSARTLGLILQALIVDSLVPGRTSDRVLNGPTSEVWIEPWVAHLEKLGVRFRTGALKRFRSRSSRISSAVVQTSRGLEEVEADAYLAALPYEVLDRILTADIRALAPSLAGLSKLKSEWMNGIQYYLDRDLELVEGHCILLDSPWALTAISQRQFWTGIQLADYGDGRTRGVLSVDISNWNAPGPLYGKPAAHCTRGEIEREVWAQLKLHFNTNGTEVLHDGALIRCFLDPAIVFRRKDRPINTEPLFINSVGSLKYRPHASTEIENLCVAGDFVRTSTDLATMEAANESARRAVNAIFDRMGPSFSRCTVWPLSEPRVLAPFKAMDARRFEKRLPHAWYEGPGRTAIAGVDNVASSRDPIFQKNKTEGHTRIGRARTLVPLPFHAYAADALVLYGTGRLTFMKKLLRETELWPVVAGPGIGYAMLWVIGYGDTSCGPYKEVVVNFVVSHDSKRRDLQNDFSGVAAMLDPAHKLFTVQLLLDQQLPIDYGREVYGLDKRLARIDIRREGQTKYFQCTEPTGKLIVAGRVQETDGEGQAATLLGLARNMSLVKLAEGMWKSGRGEPAMGILITRDIRSSSRSALSEISGTYKFAPSFARWGGASELVISKSTDFGRLLVGLDFKPLLYGWDRGMKTVLRARGDGVVATAARTAADRSRRRNAIRD